MKPKPLILVTEKAWIFPFLASTMVSLTIILAAMVSTRNVTTITSTASTATTSRSDDDDDDDANRFEIFSSINRMNRNLDLDRKNLSLYAKDPNPREKDPDARDDWNLRGGYPKDSQNGSIAPVLSPVEPRMDSSSMPIQLPRLAYLISGTKGDGRRMKRVLQAIYHPNNIYILHLDLEAPPKERIDLARFVKQDPTFIEFGNVDVITKANLVTYRGPTMITCTLHAAAILLKKDKGWDWFINLSASDYPLLTQDDLLYGLSRVPRDLNFIEHSSNLGWKEYQRVKPIIIDPGLYLSKKAEVFLVSQRRAVPNAFKMFVGSAWVVLTRSFVEYCVRGYDNLPRTVLMYYANIVSSPEGYFHTVICNAREYRNTTVNHDLHYIAWDNPPRQHPLVLSLRDLGRMKSSGAPFARKFDRDDSVLDRIDRELLGRRRDRFTPGAWCIGNRTEVNTIDPCSQHGESTLLKPGPGSKRFGQLLSKLLSPRTFRMNQCNSTS